MGKYRLTQRADDELFEIFLYGFEWFGETQAERYRAGLQHCFELLAANPRLGRAADIVSPGLHRHEHASHVILYEEEPGGVLIVAIVHGRSIRRLRL